MEDCIKQNWKFIEDWLDNNARHFGRNSLAPGTTDKELKQFKEDLKTDFPADFCNSYLLHNGFRVNIGLIHAGDLLSVKDIRQRWYTLNSKNQSVNWDKNMVPFVEFNETDFLCININDKQIYWAGIDNEEKRIETYKTHNSFSGFLSDLVNDLKSGRGLMDEMLSE